MLGAPAVSSPHPCGTLSSCLELDPRRQSDDKEHPYTDCHVCKMDIAYDQIQEEGLPEDQSDQGRQQGGAGGLNSEFQEAFKAVSASPWGAKLGGFFGQVKKQVCTFEDLTKLSLAADTRVTERIFLHRRPARVQQSLHPSHQRPDRTTIHSRRPNEEYLSICARRRK